MVMKKDWNWIKEIPGYEDHFGETMKIAIGIMGFDNFMEFMEVFGKQTIYFSEAPLRSLMREYANLHPAIPVQELARKFHVQEKTIYNMRNGNNKDENQKDLFEEL